MLKTLELGKTGPVSKVRLELAERLNILTGDNGLGKTFLLDIAWWALTRTWAGLPALGRRTNGDEARIAWSELDKNGKEVPQMVYTQAGLAPENWPRHDLGEQPTAGLVVYARVDGSFGVFDPVRNFRYPFFSQSSSELPPAFLFEPAQVWYGLPRLDPQEMLSYRGLSGFSGARSNAPEQKSCMGLLYDWVLWQSRPDELPFTAFVEVLRVLSEGIEEPILPGEKNVRLMATDARPIPTLKLSYGTIPILHASAAIKRVLALAYLLVWTWTEHLAQCISMNIPSDYRLVLLIDEVEAHLHPLWQRCVLPALLKAAEKLIQNVKVQVIASTHSPMVLASLEPHFDASKDRLFNCHFGQGQVKIEEIPWCKQGDITNWLVSEAFGLQQARSVEAERAIEAAEAFMRGEAAPKDLETKDKIHEELCRVLPGHDPFWPRWIVKTQYQRP